ncbi:MAG: hypothetical protein M0C28_45635 [Candidatus Moduliflexus flocculans]|nr:hypothetical protein [Candidatus Moduliflexus flocculans]
MLRLDGRLAISGLMLNHPRHRRRRRPLSERLHRLRPARRRRFHRAGQGHGDLVQQADLPSLLQVPGRPGRAGDPEARQDRIQGRRFFRLAARRPVRRAGRSADQRGSRLPPGFLHRLQPPRGAPARIGPGKARFPRSAASAASTSRRSTRRSSTRSSKQIRRRALVHGRAREPRFPQPRADPAVPEERRS